MAAPIHRIGVKLQLLKTGKSWMRCLAHYSESKSSKSTSASSVRPRSIRHDGERVPSYVFKEDYDSPHEVKHGDGVSKFYSKKYGVGRDVQSWLYWKVNINDTRELELLLQNKKLRELKEKQSCKVEYFKIFGDEIAAAYAAVSVGGSVKLVNREQWFKMNEKGQCALPRSYVPGLSVEAIDVSKTDFTYVAMDSLDRLQNLRYLNLSNCKHVGDWTLMRLHSLSESLEFLDISNCPQITDWGLASLHSLRNLQVLKVGELPEVKLLGLMTLLLEEHIPGLQVLGVTEADLQPPASQVRGERKMVQAALGLIDEEEETDNSEEDMEFAGLHSDGGFFNHPRKIRKVDW